MSNGYAATSRLQNSDYVTDPRVPDPENLPEPLGWNLLVRPYPISEKTKSGLFLTSEDRDYLTMITNIGRVVSVGPCCWNKEEHGGPWAQVGDFITYPKHTGAYRKFKGVSFVILGDDQIVERLPDPLVFGEGSQSYMNIDIPEEDLKKYNTIYKEA